VRANVNLLTAASEAAVTESVDAYEQAVAAHVTGDLGAHNQVRLYTTPYAEPVSGHTIADAYLLRLQLSGTNTDGTGDGVFTLPAVVTGTVYSVGDAPSILRQPLSQTAVVGARVTLTVKAVGRGTLAYQWQKNGTSISGATAASLVLSNVQTTAQASYTVVITSEFGETTSAAADLTVETPDPRVSSSVDGCFTGDTLILMADGSQRPIRELRAGDRVRTYRLEGLNPDNEDAWKTWSTTNLQATPSSSTVQQVFQQRFTGYYRLLGLKVTFEHPLLTRRNGVWQFRQVARLLPGDFLWKNGVALPIASIETSNETVETYNLNVEPDDVYVANGALAHNNFFKDLFG